MYVCNSAPKFHTDSVNQCLQNKSSRHLHLFEFKSIIVKLILSHGYFANVQQQKSNESDFFLWN